MEQTKLDWLWVLLTRMLIVLVYITRGVCWLLKTINSYFVEWLDLALKQLKQNKENPNVIDVPTERSNS